MRRARYNNAPLSYGSTLHKYEKPTIHSYEKFSFLYICSFIYTHLAFEFIFNMSLVVPRAPLEK